MPDPAVLTALADRFNVDFTGPIGHQKVTELARAWLPHLNFHEVEMYHSIDLEELYTVPAIQFAGFDPPTQAQFAISVGGVPAAPPVIRVGNTLHGSGATADDALLQAAVDGNAVYSHGGSVRAGDKFFGSTATLDGTPVADATNPRLPRLPLRVRTEFRMLLETLKQTLVLVEAQIDTPVDAIWGDFDVTDLLLRRISNVGGDAGPASRNVRHQFARELIAAFEAGDFIGVGQKLQSPPQDGLNQTKANETVWTALSLCGFIEYNFIYAYNDFARYGGVFTNEHEGDNEGCCVVFERLALQDLQAQNGDAEAVAPLGLITSVHNEFEPRRRAARARPGSRRRPRRPGRVHRPRQPRHLPDGRHARLLRHLRRRARERPRRLRARRSDDNQPAAADRAAPLRALQRRSGRDVVEWRDRPERGRPGERSGDAPAGGADRDAAVAVRVGRLRLRSAAGAARGLGAARVPRPARRARRAEGQEPALGEQDEALLQTPDRRARLGSVPSAAAADRHSVIGVT